jgi:tetratricopeptide (TPR) repeat protein
MAEADLQGALRKLTDAELLYVRGIAPDASYLFKHALIRDTAYEALLKSRRRELHRVVANTIDEKFSALKETHPEMLARHWTEAGETERAIAEWSKAGKAAETRNAFSEALNSYQQALAVLSLLPESLERDSRELELRQSPLSMLYATKGYAAPETIEAIDQAIPLAEKSGNATQLVNWLTSRASALLVSGDLPGAGAVADRVLELALRAQGTAINLGRVYQVAIITGYHRGDLAGAEKHFAAWLAFFGDGRFRPSPPNAVNTFAFVSFNAWLLGRADLARERDGRMMATAKEGSPFDVANSEYCGALLELYMREYERAQARAGHALELATKHQFPNPAARARGTLGIALAHLGRATEGIGLIRQAIAGARDIGTRMAITITTSALAEAQGLEGAIADALETVELALQVNPDEIVIPPRDAQDTW